MFLFLRFFAGPVALVGWILFQLFVKKKKWADVEGDARVAVFFVIIWVAISFALLH